LGVLGGLGSSSCVEYLVDNFIWDRFVQEFPYRTFGSYSLGYIHDHLAC